MRERSVVAFNLPIVPLKNRSGLELYRDANLVPVSPLVDYLATTTSGPVWLQSN